jgi:prefoldin subunit 5
VTRRERLEAKLEKRRAWALSRHADTARRFNTAHKLTEGIPFGQPILVGHHSEKRHRRTLEKADNAMRKGCESADMAKHHEGKADGLERQLERSIFSDDPDALESLEARIKELEERRERKKKINALYRKGNADGLKALGIDLEKLRESLNAPGVMSWCRTPFPAYELQNLGGNITRLRKRIVEVKRRQAITEAAEAAPSGVLVQGTGEYVRVTFADKPSRSTIDALKQAGFRWGAGSWTGRRDALPVIPEAASPEAESNPT